MKVLKIKKVEGCLEGTNVRDILFDNKITPEFVEFIGRLGRLILNDKIAKPFFTVIVKGKFTLKGSIGNKTCRILLPDEGWEGKIEEIKNYFSLY